MPEKMSSNMIVGLILLAVLILTGMTYMNCKKNVSERLTNVSNSNDSDNVSMGSSNSSASTASSATSGSTASSATSATSASASTASSAPSVQTSSGPVLSASNNTAIAPYSQVASGVPALNAAVTQNGVTIKRGQNANTTATYKNMSYVENDRGGAGDIDRYFMDGNPEDTANPNNFGALDHVSNKYAAYVTAKTDEGLLPVEDVEQSGWFEDPTPVRIKNSQIINIYRQVGVNTQGTSRKNASLDIRGAPANPKTVVSPFLNSSIDPDVNIKGLCL